MKIKAETVFAVLAVVAVALYAGWLTIPGFNFTGGNIGGGGTGVPGQEIVNKPIKFTLQDKYGGSVIDSDASGLVVYGTDLTQKESLNTDANGQVTTSDSYASGTVLNVMTNHDSMRQWFVVTVPKMSAADADSLTTTSITLASYVYTAPTMAVRTAANVTGILDGGEYNQTIDGTSPTFTVTWFQPTDGRGYISSFDPIYGVQNMAVLVAKVSNTNYETISLSGWDGMKSSGAANYYYHVISDASLSKWKIGDAYKYPGSGSFSFSASLSGYTGDLGDLDLYIYEVADPAWFITHGTWGPNSLSVIAGAPFTINMEEGD